MRGKKANLHKSMLKERNKPSPPPAKQETPAPGGTLFTTLFQTMGQGMAFGAGSSIGHRTIDIVSGLWGNKEEISKPNISTTTVNNCDDLKREFVACMQNNDHCNEAQSQYLQCLDKIKHN